MNKTFLNVVSLAKDPFIRKDEGGGGGGVTINNQEKSLEITENGVTEVKPDAGFTGLSKVIVNTNVASSGGGGSDMPVIGDGKTYLYITIAAEGRMNVPLYFSQTKANGVTIDWGDGSAPETLSGTGNKNTTHKYAAIGDYVISLDPVDGCTLGLGWGSSSYCVMGSTANNSKVYCNMLRAVEIGKNSTVISGYAFQYCFSLASIVIPEGVKGISDYVFRSCYSLASVVIPEGVTSIGKYVFSGCSSLASVVIPESITSIGNSAFVDCSSLASIVIPESVTYIGDSMFSGCSSLASVVIPESVTGMYMSVFSNCYSLASVVIPEGVTVINSSTFNNCYSLASVVIPESITYIGSSAFKNCYGAAFYDFSNCTSIPTLDDTNAFTGISSDCKIIVPDALYDEWIAATNWSSYASRIIKKSDWDAQS